MYSPPDPNHIYRLYLLRHGQSEGNAKGVLQGLSEFPLSPIGELQAQALANHWREHNVRFHRILSSPLGRARQIAEIIGQALDAPIDYDSVWQERNNGKLAGLLPEEIAERFPRATQWNLYEAVGDDGESQWELFLRAGRAVQSIFTHPPGDYLVVSHGGLLNQVVHVALGIFPQTHLHATRFRFHNTGYAILQYNIDRQSWLVECINEHGHWKPRS